LKKNCFSLYIILRVILQLGGLGNVIGGITRAAEVGDETGNGKFNLWYQ